MMPRRPLAIRSRLLATMLAVAAVILAALVLAFNVALRVTLDRDASNVARARAQAILATVATSGGDVTAQEAPDDAALDAQVWIYAGGHLVEGPQRSTGPLNTAAAAAAAGAPGQLTASGVRLAAVPVSAGGRTVGSVVAGVPLSPYQATERAALLASIVLAGALFGAIALLSRWTLRRALQPVNEMTRLASEWSERHPDRRFAQGAPRDEVTELAGTLDQMLDRIAGSLRREQRLSAELAHELRTPLARVSAECELALRRDDIDDDTREAFQGVARSAADMRGTIDVLIAAARHDAGLRGVSDAADVVHAIAARAAPVGGGRIHVRADAAAPLRIAVDADLATRILDPVVDNAIRHAATEVVLAARADGGAIEIVVEDDGPGITATDRDRIFEPGGRGAGARSAGAGLGLALARRLAGEVAGTIDALPSSAGGRFLVRLPRA